MHLVVEKDGLLKYASGERNHALECELRNSVRHMNGNMYGCKILTIAKKRVL